MTASEFLPQELVQAIAEDGEALAMLHDRELTPEFMAVLREVSFPGNLGLLPRGEFAETAWNMMKHAVEQWPVTPGPGTAGMDAEMDELAAEYAAIYLTGAYGASPCESVWVDDDHLVCQESMFELREIYAAAGLETVSWRHRPDDHLVLQLLYISHAARRAEGDEDWRALAKVMDEHLLRWLPDFSNRVVSRTSQAFYGALALLTDAWCSQVRHVLSLALGEPRPTREEVEERLRPARNPVAAVPLTFMPGVAPSW